MLSRHFLGNKSVLTLQGALAVLNSIIPSRGDPVARVDGGVPSRRRNSTEHMHHSVRLVTQVTNLGVSAYIEAVVARAVPLAAFVRVEVFREHSYRPSYVVEGRTKVGTRRSMRTTVVRSVIL
jgi:hypothetical protein